MLFIYSVPNKHNNTKYIRHLNKVIIIIIIIEDMKELRIPFILVSTKDNVLLLIGEVK